MANGTYRGNMGAQWLDLWSGLMPHGPTGRRVRILDAALQDHVLPALRAEVEADLERQGMDHITAELGAEFWRLVMQPPLQVVARDEDDPDNPELVHPKALKVRILASLVSSQCRANVSSTPPLPPFFPFPSTASRLRLSVVAPRPPHLALAQPPAHPIPSAHSALLSPPLRRCAWRCGRRGRARRRRPW